MAEEQKTDKLKMHSPDLIKANIEKLAELFPNCVTEAQDEDGNPKRAIDFDQLRQELSDHVVDGPRERYQLNWPGKREALLAANVPIVKTLRPQRCESVDFDTTKNLFIEGDNLDSLKLLQETYLNKVKLIYIDPPYNTGTDLIYDDDFREGPTSYKRRSGEEDDSGNRLVSNTLANGRFHSDWLSMMQPRLRLARNLLRDDGVLLVSIDDNEIANLRLLCDEIFGADNFIAEMVWEGANKNDARQIGVCHEYVLIYAKNRLELPREWGVEKEGVEPVLKEVERLQKKYGDDYKKASAELAGWFRSMKATPSFGLRRFRNIDARGAYKEDDPTAPGGRKFDLINPYTGEVIPLRRNRGWSFDQAEFERLVRENRITFVSNTSIMVRRYLHETSKATPQSVFYQPARSASERLNKLLGGAYFDYPKDEKTIERFVEMSTDADDSDAIVLDFFAGSATMAHSVLSLNARDGGNRRYICVQLPEQISKDSEAGKAGFDNIAQIGRERIRQATRAIKESNPDATIDCGFRCLTVDTSNMKDVYYTPDAVSQEGLFGHIDNIKDDRTDEDLLFQVLLDWGVDLSLRIQPETIAEKTVYFVDENALAACFEPDIDEDFVKALAQRKPLRAVFRDCGYGSDSTKINVEQIFKLISPTTEVKTI